MTTNTNNTELANVENKPSQLITLEPEKYVAEVFAAANVDLKKAIKEHGKVTYDIKTKDGMAVAKAARSAFKKVRTEAENTRKDRKAPIIEIGKLIDSEYKKLEAKITPHEEKFDADIKAEEKRIEEEKQRAIEAEKARVAAIENRIDQIRNVPMQLSASSSAQIVDAIQQWSDAALQPDDFEEFLDDAINAVNAALVSLERLRVQAVEREATEAKAAAERAELERLRAEREQREKEEAERRAKEAAERAAEEARRREADAAKDKEMAELRAQLAALQKPKEEPVPAVQPKEEEKPADQTICVQPTDTVVSGVTIPAGAYINSAKLRANTAKIRPTDGAIIAVLMDHFKEDRATVLNWLRSMELDEAAA